MLKEKMLKLLQYIKKQRGINESRKRTKKEKEEHIVGTGILDDYVGNSSKSKEDLLKEFAHIFNPNGPAIYAFTTDLLLKDSAIKIGYTDQHPEKRIQQWRKTFEYKDGEEGLVCLGYWSSEEIDQAGQQVFFWDHAVHDKVEKRGFANVTKEEFYNMLSDKGKERNGLKTLHYSSEFFRKYGKLLKGKLTDEQREELSVDLIQDIIIEMHKAIRDGQADFKLYKLADGGQEKADEHYPEPDRYTSTELQEEAIKNGVKAITDGKTNLLLAAVMRFGKTHACYEIVKKAGLKRVLVTSAKADVRKAWRDDINHEDFYKEFVFVEFEDGAYKFKVTSLGDDGKLVTKVISRYAGALEETVGDKTMIMFCTLHDLGGSVKELKEKHKGMFDGVFDLMIVDETHYGSHSSLFGKVTKLGQGVAGEDYDEEEVRQAKEDREVFEKAKLEVKYKTVLQVSGTPYYILASNEMLDKNAEVISDVSFTDMLKAKAKWVKDHPNRKEEESPYFGIPTIHKIGLRLTKECSEAIADAGMTTSMNKLFAVKNGKFVNEHAIEGLMKGLFGDGSSDTLAFLKNKKVEGDKICKHTMIVLPRINACVAMKKLLQKFISEDDREVIEVVSNNADVTDVKELNSRLAANEKAGRKTIILTVVKFLTGTTMPLVDSMIYLKNASSPQEYDQNVFRICSRNVLKVQNPDDDSPKRVNMKDNVYLIDFNIDNMFNMLMNSARMKARTERNPDPKRVREIMQEEVDAIPVWAESGDNIMGRMKEIKGKDLMELYSGYNKNKSIEAIANDEIDMFTELFMDEEFQKAMSSLSTEGDSSKNKGPEGNETGDGDITVTGNAGGKEDGMKNLKDFSTDKEKQKKAKEAKEKFKAIAKKLMYLNLCLDDPYDDVSELLKDASKDKELVTMIEDFRMDLNDVRMTWKALPANYKSAFNLMLLKISILAADQSEKDFEKYQKAMGELGRLGKSEVVTPMEIVEKMINKLPDEEYKNAKSILLVNEKQAEFFYGIYKKFGEDVAKKCRIVPSSQVGKHLTTKLLKTLDMNDYINDIILELEDYDKSGKIDVKDFLNMNNNEILKNNGGKKFDICLMNPPYSGSTHLKFLAKTIEIADKVVSIQPTRWLEDSLSAYKKSSALNKYETSVAKHIKELQTIKTNESKTLFNSGSQVNAEFPMNLGIYVCDEDGGYDYKFNNKLFDKIIKQIKTKWSDVIKYKTPDNGVVITTMVGGKGGLTERTLGIFDWYEDEHFIYEDGKRLDNGLTFYENRLKTAWGNVKPKKETTFIEFNSVKESHNFIKFTKLYLFRYLIRLETIDIHLHEDFLPFMNDYTHEWTNEMLYKEFDITKDEQKEIEDLVDYYVEYNKKVDNKWRG